MIKQNNKCKLFLLYLIFDIDKNHHTNVPLEDLELFELRQNALKINLIYRSRNKTHEQDQNFYKKNYKKKGIVSQVKTNFVIKEILVQLTLMLKKD